MSRITTVAYLRQLARNFGDTTTARGQALHKAAAHLIRMDEELQRCLVMVSAQSSYEERVESGAQGIARVMRAHRAAKTGEDTFPEWTDMLPSDQESLRDFARAALGAPVYERPDA